MKPTYPTIEQLVTALNTLEVEIAVYLTLVPLERPGRYARNRYTEAGIPLDGGSWQLDWAVLRQWYGTDVARCISADRDTISTARNEDWERITYYYVTS